ncbi:MAG: Gfo/Idh/MocA family oxidoreductase [Patescibacteria group bacterium]
MRILTGTKWRDGYLDYHRNKLEYRIQTLAWKNLEKLEGVYHTRAKSFQLLWNYFPVVGLEGLVMKTWSRLREERRNEKYLSCGIGKVIEGPTGSAHAPGAMVGFVAPWHPAAVERIVLPETFIFSLDSSLFSEAPPGTILHLPLEGGRPAHPWWQEVRAWSVYSGINIKQETIDKIREGIAEELKRTNWASARRIEVGGATPVAMTKTKRQGTGDGRQAKSGILYGFGNYAKINIIPYSKPFVDIQTVHEIDPTQIFMGGRIGRWDASPFPRPDERADAYFVASYNHTHVPITLHALKSGAYVVVEKPVAMDYGELKELEAALRQAGRKLFIGFHKRYGTFNRLALQDLRVEYGEPISYHSIVYELIQPELFWYNWPVSRSTFFANGCHQIDHFLHLNNFSKPRSYDIKLLQDDAVEVWIELENGATFTTTFSEKGVSRVGPRDFVELKVHGRNVRITDAIRYQSEDNHRIIRRRRIFKTDSYRDMYQTICRTIAEDGEGDSLESVLVSTKLMLDLEEKLQKMKKWGDRYERAKEEFKKYFS